MELLLGLLLICVIFFLINRSTTFDKGDYRTEGFSHFNRTNGTYCYTCANKNYNECVSCFNCGWCVDKWGNGSCIGATVAGGPMNNERCELLYFTDPFPSVRQDNYNYRCSYGPQAANRAIGINPTDCRSYGQNPLTMPGVSVHQKVAAIA